ncbi:hypothetical protein TWF696_005193 [Orbilia brochopaga]|uniref:Transmembrane protein n=1 Tax=Orbilia brochopaga TaxID=3140254 RepID=A0AAV9V036_9PEZI
MPPSGEMVGHKRDLGILAKAQDDQESGDDDESLEKFLDEWDIPHGGDVAGGIDRTDGPRRPHDDDGGPGRPESWSPGHERPYPNTFPPPPAWPPDRTPHPPDPYIVPSSLATPTPSGSLSFSLFSSSPPSSILPGTLSTLCVIDRYGSTVSTKTVTNTSGARSGDTYGISYKTVSADTTPTVTDTATIVLSGEATRVLFPQHDKSNPPPPGPSHGHPKARLRDILLGVSLGAGMVLLLVACWFGYRAHKRKKKARGMTANGARNDSEGAQEGAAPEMQTTGVVVTMPSISGNRLAEDLPTAGPPPSLPPPFMAQAATTALPPARPENIQFSAHPSDPPIIINPFSDPTYNSSSGIEDYVVSNGIPLGREPENPFLHPDDGPLGILGRTRPNSAGDFPPEYTTVDGNPIDASGQRVREERFPFGDEALSLRTESETGSVRHGSTRESIPEYMVDDPNGVADGFRYNSTIAGRLPL